MQSKSVKMTGCPLTRDMCWAISCDFLSSPKDTVN